ncbi:AMP-binding protein [Gemmata sp. G18]|uniref:AMP-binding protein n=1 Tax=Gemmata palustris TaxID=2822762 RepID=A0ABS5C4U7_9BACT|nr:AMP-binding protein [Gemmata palustris]MBP3961013.1 AMP-binding protein [Gemmata palustris]
MTEPAEVALVLAAVFVLGGVLTWALPSLLRPVLWLVANGLYRFTVYHRERVPARGGTLIVANHVSYVDWLVLWVACPRSAAFVLWGGYYCNPVLRFFLSWARHNTIRVANRTTRPHAVNDSLKQIAAALDAGRMVVMFPEGALTRTGNMLPFGRGIERILKLAATDVSVIPACTTGLWNGFFSHGAGRILWKWPKAFRPRVSVLFGEAKKPTPPSPLPEGKGVSEEPTPPAPFPEGKGEQARDPAEIGTTRGGGSFSPFPSGRGAGGVGSADSRTPSGRGAGRVGSPLRAADIRLAVQEATAELSILESDHLLLVHRRFVRVASKLRRLFRPAIVDYSGGSARTLTWAKVLVGALCVTRFLQSRVGEAQNVGIWLPTGLGSALANISVAFLGKTSVNLNYTAGTAAVRSAVKQAGVRFVITAKKFTARVPLDLPDDVQLIYLEDALESVTKGQRVRTFLLVLLLPGWAIDYFLLGLSKHRPDDVLTIVFSSGSTGEPKGVVLTHRNITANTDASRHTLEVVPGETLFGILPFFHSFGYTVCLWLPMNAPCTAVYFPDPRQAKEVGDLARTHRATVMAATATFLRFYIRRCGADDFRTLRLIICGAEKLPVKLQDEFRAKFGVLPLEGYGCTELSPVVSCNMPDVNIGGMLQQRNYRGTVGQPIFGVCTKAFDPNTMEPLPIGAEGVLCSKGPNVMVGYLNQPEKTANVIRDGWYNTGDAGLIEPEGFIRITGRLSRFAKIAGEMIPLERLDDEMHDALATGGDRVLAVAAVPDEKRGERVVVLYLPEIEAKLPDLLAALPKRGIPNLWVPDRRDCYPVDAMPVLGTGKLDLKKLSDLAKQLATGKA